jgi:hypothetical protein
LLAGEGAALGRLADAVEPLPATPLRALVLAAAEATATCAWFETTAWAPELAALPGALGCVAAPPDLAERLGGGEHPLWLALPAQAVGRFGGWIDLDADGGITAEARLLDPPVDPPWSVLLPSERAPAAPVLNCDGILFHALLRPEGGLDLQRAVAEGSEFDKLFKLRSGLFGTAALEGSLEIAVYSPGAGQRTLPLVIALPHRVRAAAVVGIEALVEALQRDWPVYRKPLATPAGEGACLPDLNLVPDFGPCYLATDRALVVGWNQAALERGLAPGPRPEPPPSGEVTLDLAGFGAADDALAATHGLAPRRSAHLPWTRVVLRQERRGAEVRYALRAEGRAP